MTRDAYEIEVTRLRRELDEAREEIRQLRKAAHPPSAIFPPEWKLCPTHQRILAAFVASPLLSDGSIHRLLLHHETVISDNIIRVHVSKLRQKVRPYGVTIETVRGWGYRLAPESIPILRAALQQEQIGRAA